MADDDTRADATEAEAEAEESAPKGLLAKLSPGKVIGAVKSAPSAAVRSARATVSRALKERTPLEGAKDLWPVPALLVSAAVAVGGVSRYINTAPEADFKSALASVEELVNAGRHDEALDRLNDPIGRLILSEQASELDRALFYAVSADTIYATQDARGFRTRSNDERIVEFYESARATPGFDLSATRLDRLIDTKLALGKVDAALAEAERFGEGYANRRHAVIRRVVGDALSKTELGMEAGAALELIGSVALDPEATESDRLWAVEWRARLQLRSGAVDAAIDRLLTELQSLESRSTPEAGRLFVLLARGYMLSGQTEAAVPHLERAMSAVGAASEAMGEAEVLLAEAYQQRGESALAQDLYQSVSERFAHAAAGVRAQLGLAELAAEQGRYVDAQRAYGSVLTGLERGQAGTLVSKEAALDSMSRLFERLHLEGNSREALQFAQLIERSFGDEPPAGALSRTAGVHRAIADQLIESVPRASDGLPDFSAVDAVTLEEARSHYYRSARRYQRVAKDQMLADPEGAADALWNAADGFDRSGDLKAARGAFAEYVQLRTSEDPRQVRALYRLARASQAANRYDEAVELFERLLEEHPTSSEGYASYVPLAQCYMLMGEGASDERAEALLRSVVEGQIVDPAAPEYRDAMIELGMLYMRSEHYAASVRYPRAIELFSTAIERYQSLASEPRVVLALANANRLSAEAIAQDLAGTMRASERERWRETRVERLRDAIELYETGQNALRAAGPDSDELSMRNAMLYRADCAYELGKHFSNEPTLSGQYFTEAIKLYDTAARRYPDDPASLVAMVQIVNCHVQLGNSQHARTAQRKARSRLDELTDAQLESSEMPMSRGHWEEWLDSTTYLDRMAAADTR